MFIRYKISKSLELKKFGSKDGIVARKIKRRDRSNSPRRIKRRRTGIIRKRKFTALRRKIIITAIESRLPIGRACELASIEYDTYRKWMEKGKEKSKYPLYYKFRKRIHKAQAKVELEALDIIRKSAKGGNRIVETTVTVGPKGQETKRVVKEQLPVWQAAAWYLERRHKKDYGRDVKDEEDKKSAEEHAQEVKSALEAMMDTIPDEQDEACLPADMP